MRRRAPWLVLLLGACAPAARGGSPAAAPAPAPSEAAAAAPAEAAVPAAPRVDSALVVALTDEVRLTADSAADQAMLQQLADAHPDSADAASADVEVPATWDIDVATWGDHDRVQYYLRFFQGPARERMQIWIDRLPRWEPMIRARLEQEGLPSDMLYLALIESGFSTTAVSRARAVGMWQFMAGTARHYGLRIDRWVDERRDPVKATDAAARHLRDLRERFGSLYLAAAAYNAGGGKISRGLRKIGAEPAADPAAEEDDGEAFTDADFFRLYDTRHIRRETKDYVPKLIAAALIAKEPAKYGFRAPETAAPFAADSIVVAGMTGLDVIARLADTTLAAVRELNPHLLRLTTPPVGRAVVRVPAGKGDAVAAAYAELPPEERVSFAVHTVKRGETLARVAKQYGVTVQAVADANPAWRSRSLRAGATLYVPTGGPMSPAVAREIAALARQVDAVEFHRVTRGETLSHLSRRYGVSQASLRRWNGLGPKGMIRIGQRLRVSAPDATQTRSLAARAPSRAAASSASKGKGRAASARGPGAASRARTHLVRRGETLTSIARRYGVTVAALREANALGDVLKAGSRLRIPPA